jgi:hypothetical protein
MTSSTITFRPPPLLHNVRGEVRKAGFEFEYAGLRIDHSARLVRDLFDGQIVGRSTFLSRVETDLGPFKIEIDAVTLRERKYENLLRAVGIDPATSDTRWLEEALLGAAATVVPIEIAAPPIAIDQLDVLEELRRRLMRAGARGTGASLLYAFGMHINPEIPDPHDAAALLDHLRAFLLLYPWLREQVGLDLTRRISPFVNPFPAEYARLVLQPDYPPTTDRLIDDYLAHNATRNRALDLLPALACIDEPRVLARVEDKHLVKPRPSFHYRLPNSRIDEPDWTLAREWNTWVVVERLANDKATLARMSWEYLKADRNAMRPLIDEWPGMARKWVKQSEYLKT